MRGLRPVLAPRFLVAKVPKPLSSTRFPQSRAYEITSKMVATSILYFDTDGLDQITSELVRLCHFAKTNLIVKIHVNVILNNTPRAKSFNAKNVM